MTNHLTPLDWVVNAIAGGAFLGFLVFILIYVAFANWRSTAPGRALMYAIGSLNVMVLMATVHLFTGRYPGIEFVRSTVYLLLLFSAWRLVWVLVKILLQGQPITVETFVQRKPVREKEK